jgi:hypothetical protein
VTLGRLTLAAALGMALTGLTVYALTVPTGRPPVVAPGPSPEASAPLKDAADDSTAERDDLAELQREVERLRALLDASIIADASLDASVSDDGGAEASVRAPAPPVLPAPRSCSKPLPDRVVTALFAQVPALRELPPDKLAALLENMRKGSPECDCSTDPFELTLCADWCRAKGLPTSRCVVGKCQCSQ